MKFNQTYYTYICTVLLVICSLSFASTIESTPTTAAAAAADTIKQKSIISMQQCTIDSECDAKQYCTSEGHCQRRGILPLSFPEIFGSLLIISILGFAQAAGVGGGTSIMPILIALFLYDTKKSVAIVIVLVFSGSLGNTIQHAHERTKTGVPVIDYRLILLTLPALVVGAVYGVAMNKLLPPLVVCLCLVGLLLQQVLKQFARYKSMKYNELSLSQSLITITEERKQPPKGTNSQQQQSIVELEDIQSGGLLDNSDQNAATSNNSQANSQQQQQQQLLRPYIEKEHALYPKSEIIEIILMSVFVIVFSLVRGGSKFASLVGIPPCGLGYQCMNLLLAAILFKWVKSIIERYDAIEKTKESYGYSFPHGRLTRTAMIKYAETGIVAGGIGAMLGIGGGIILIPRWLEYGISSMRTTACTLTIICFTTFNSFFQLYLSGSYNIEEIVFFSILALVSSLICRAIKSHVKRTNEDSLLILILVVFMALAASLLSGVIIYNAFLSFEDSIKFGRFC